MDATQERSSVYMTVEEVMRELMVGKTTAYQTIKKSNDEAKKKGLPVRRGKMRRDYFMEYYRPVG